MDKNVNTADKSRQVLITVATVVGILFFVVLVIFIFVDHSTQVKNDTSHDASINTIGKILGQQSDELSCLSDSVKFLESKDALHDKFEKKFEQSTNSAIFGLSKRMTVLENKIIFPPTVRHDTIHDTIRVSVPAVIASDDNDDGDPFGD